MRRSGAHRVGLGAEHGVDMHREEHARAVGDGDLGVRAPGASPHSPRSWRTASTIEEHAVHAGVGVREPAAVGVHRQRPRRAELAVGHERAALALGAEAEVLEVQQRR